jgi:putative endonuclease
MARSSHACLVLMGKVFIVYIMASMKGGTVYTGVTGNPAGRIWQHKNHVDPRSFTARHKVTRLVWYEVHETAISAIQREKRIKDWLRPWKDRLIEENNRPGGTCRMSCGLSGACPRCHPTHGVIPAQAGIHAVNAPSAGCRGKPRTGFTRGLAKCGQCRTSF